VFFSSPPTSQSPSLTLKEKWQLNFEKVKLFLTNCVIIIIILPHETEFMKNQKKTIFFWINDDLKVKENAH
jgi:hypothetical protein